MVDSDGDDLDHSNRLSVFAFVDIICCPSFCNCVEIDITRIGFDCFKTGRDTRIGDTRIDTIYATVYGVLAAMFPACFEYSNDENYNDTLKNIAKTIPPFVAAWKTKDVAVVAKVGGKAKKVKGSISARGPSAEPRCKVP